jgi:asparagine synthase (glutamine-hydrolysing)
LRPELKAQVLDQDLLRQLDGYDSLNVLRFYYDRADTADPLSRIQYVDIKTYLTDDILVKVDRASMAHSLEVRAPILDHKLMELAASMPSSLKLRGTHGKYIFKKALKQVLPEAVLERKKMGFAVPLAKWFRSDLKELAHAVMFSRNGSNLVNQASMRRVWEEHQSGLRDRSTELWTLLMFRLWERQFMTGEWRVLEPGREQIRLIG